MTPAAGAVVPRLHPARRALALCVGAAILVAAYAEVLRWQFGLALPVAGATAVFAAATISSIAGFAFSALCGPVLAQLDIGPVRMVQTMALCSIAIQGWSVWSLRRNIDFRAVARLLAGGLCALPLGVKLLLYLPRQDHTMVLGALVVAYGLWALFRPPLRLIRPPGLLADLLVGATGGLTGALAAFPGAIVAVWCGLRGWPKERQRGVFQTYILAMQIAALGVIAVMARDGDLAPSLDLAALAYVPAALLGAACGLRLFHGLTDVQFGRVVNLLLVVAGIGLLL